MTVRRLTEEMYDGIPTLLEQGMDKHGIAMLYGVTVNTLAVQCSRRGITLRKGGSTLGHRSLLEAPLDLSNTVIVALRKKAMSMGTSEVRLARDLLETIIADDLYSAVLDLEVA